MQMDQIEAAYTVIGLIVLAFTSVSGLVWWFYRRMQAVARATNKQYDVSRQVSLQRMTELEQGMSGLHDDVSSLTQRVSGVEKSMETVARSSDVNHLAQSLAELRGAFSAQMHAMSGQVDTLYKAALRASNTEKSQ